MTMLFDEQGEIIRELGVAADIDPEREIERRTAFLKDYLVASGMRGYVLGISGGVDSLTAALLAQKAVRELGKAAMRPNSSPCAFPMVSRRTRPMR